MKDNIGWMLLRSVRSPAHRASRRLAPHTQRGPRHIVPRPSSSRSDQIGATMSCLASHSVISSEVSMD